MGDRERTYKKMGVLAAMTVVVENACGTFEHRQVKRHNTRPVPSEVESKIFPERGSPECE